MKVYKIIDLENSADTALKAIGIAAQFYSELLEQENCLDFSGIQTEMLKMIESFPQVLKELQTRIAYLMIDEYQDTNAIQETILLKLAEKHNRICVVGDDDQSLYRFRGATVRNILSFKKNFPEGECMSVRLETNYRSHPGIIGFYSEWMTHIPGEWKGEDGREYRYFKNIKAHDKEFPGYQPVVRVSSRDNEDAYHQEVYDFLTAQM